MNDETSMLAEVEKIFQGTLRDQFAREAMGTMLTLYTPSGPLSFKSIAFMAYEMADNMINERNSK